MIETAVVIAGGEGSRLKPLTDDRPKTMIEVNGRPILYWVINWLKSYGIKHVVIGVAYKKERIYEFMKKNHNFGLDVDFSEHSVDGGTAEAFRLAIGRYVKDENFVAMNSDELTNMDLHKLIEVHERGKPLVTMAAAPFYCRFSVMKFDRDHRIKEFTYGKKLPEIPISIGIYVFNRKVLNCIPASGSIEDTVFAKKVGEGEILGHMLSNNEGWISVNTFKDIKEAEELVKSWGWAKSLK
jgi:NDP-sugar pyrophosphorylase family protein